MNEEFSQHSSQEMDGPPLVYRIKQYKPSGVKEMLSYMLIRPPRFLYNEELLIPPQKYQEVFKYEEYLIPFKLSLYKVKDMKYVILYLHGNSSSRFEGYMHLKQLPPGVGLACFDFNGCGMRFESEFITLGKNQSKEVDIAAKYLKDKGYTVVGWGRSMGSVSLLLSSECDIMVADSPFSSLSELCRSSSEQFLPSFCCCIFNCFYPCVFCCVRSDVIQKSGLDPDDLDVCRAIQQNPRNKHRKLYVMAGEEDTMIPHHHAQKVYDCFPGKKKLKIFSGSHNSNRPINVIRETFLFIQKELNLTPHPCLLEKEKKVASKIRLKPLDNPILIKIEEFKNKKSEPDSAVKKVAKSKEYTEDEEVKSPETHKLWQSPSQQLKKVKANSVIPSSEHAEKAKIEEAQHSTVDLRRVQSNEAITQLNQEEIKIQPVHVQNLDSEVIQSDRTLTINADSPKKLHKNNHKIKVSARGQETFEEAQTKKEIEKPHKIQDKIEDKVEDNAEGKVQEQMEDNFRPAAQSAIQDYDAVEGERSGIGLIQKQKP